MNHDVSSNSNLLRSTSKSLVIPACTRCKCGGTCDNESTRRHNRM
jgi:hypothetical protein